MFFLRRSTIVVDCFVTSQPIHDLFPIRKASHFYPEWWKDLPKSFEVKSEFDVNLPVPTMKSCIGFVNLYRNGFILPLWSDLIIEKDINGCRYQFSDHKALGIRDHDPLQYTGAFQNSTHMKILSPWLLKEKTGVNFLWMEPSWNNASLFENLNILPGVMDFKYQHGTNINAIISSNDIKLWIKAGDPLAHIIPISEKNIKIKTHSVTENEYKKLEGTSYTSSFYHKYTTNKKILEANEKKCPFGFGK